MYTFLILKLLSTILLTDVLSLLSWSIIDNFPNCKHVLAGDYNFICTDNNVGFNLFKHTVDEHDLVCCDNLCHNPCINSTYCHNSLSHFSWIDQFFISKSLINSNTFSKLLTVVPTSQTIFQKVFPCNYKLPRF